MNTDIQGQRLQVNLDRQIRRLQSRTVWRTLILGLGIWLIGGGAAALAAAWVSGGDASPSAYSLGGLAISLVAGLLVLAWHWLLRPLQPLLHRRNFVLLVEQRNPCANLLVAAEESSRLPERWLVGGDLRLELVRRVRLAALDRLAVLRPADLAGGGPGRAWGRRIMLSCLIVWPVAVLAPTDVGRGLIRLMPPWQESRISPTRGLYAEIGQDWVVAGQEVEIAALDFADGRDAATCEVRSGTGQWQQIPVRQVPAVAEGFGRHAPYRKWLAVIPEARENLEWRFQRGSLRTQVCMIEVVHLPLVTRMQARVVPPPFTGLPVQDVPRLPVELAVPAGSLLQVTAAVNHPVQRAFLALAGGDTVALVGQAAEVAGDLVIKEDQRFCLGLVDSLGLRNHSPLEYRIQAVPDQAPVVRLRRPDDDGVLPISGDFQLAVEAADDFGLAEVALLLRARSDLQITASGQPDHWVRLDFWSGSDFPPTVGTQYGAWLEAVTKWGPFQVRARRVDGKDAHLQASWALEVRAGSLDLIAGDVVEIVAEALDNHQPGPPGQGRSQVLRLVLPSASEVLAQQADASERGREDLLKMRDRSRDLAADLDRLNRELLKNPLADWARQQEMNATIQRQKDLQAELERIASELRQDLDALASDQLTSPELLQKADEAGRLLSPTEGSQLEDLLAKMADEGGRVSDKELTSALQEISRNQQDMARRLDAALALLNRMAREQDLEGLAAMLARMIQEQQELADQSRDLAGQNQDAQNQDAQNQDDQAQQQDSQAGAQDSESQPSTEELARRQEALGQEMEELQEKLAEALEALQEDQSEGDPDATEEQWQEALAKALEDLQEKQKQGKMDQVSRELLELNPEQAAQLQEQALRDLGSLYHVLLETQQAMQMSMQMNQVTSLRNLAADLLALSSRQEAILERIPLELRDLRSRELLQGQYRLQRSTAGVRDRLAELLAEAPSRIMKLLQAMDDMIEDMGRGVRAIEESRGNIALTHTRESLAAMNKMVIDILTEAQASCGGGGSCSMPSLSQQLKQLAQEQAGLNGSTDELREMLANRGLSQEVRAQMKRLGQTQGDLAGRMEELARQEREKPEGSRLLGDLGELGRQMEQVSSDLDAGLVAEETLIRQERILSRLLDARNSVRRRDYSSRRESLAGDRLFQDQAGRDLGADPDGQDDPLRLRYQPLDQAPVEYRELVRRYFNALDSLRNQDGELP